MIRWFLRGVTQRRLTTRYPRAEEPPPAGFRARVLLDPSATNPRQASRAAQACLPDALTLDDQDRLRLDAARCIGCGLCVEAIADGALGIDPGYELASRSRRRLVVGDVGEADIAAELLGGPFRRSLHIRHVDAGSDGAEEWEIQALTNPYYDMQRLGLYFTLAPRHADVLLVTGGVTHSMREPLLRTFEVMPEPKAVVAVGTDTCSGGFSATSGEVAGGVDRVLPVDVYVPGSPPAPIAILHGLLLAAGVVTREAAA